MQHPQVACMSCGRRISGDQIRYRELVNDGQLPTDVFNDLGIYRYCCRNQVANPPIQPFQPTKVLENSKIERRTLNDGIVHKVKLGSTAFIKTQTYVDRTSEDIDRPTGLPATIRDRPVLVD